MQTMHQVSRSARAHDAAYCETVGYTRSLHEVRWGCDHDTLTSAGQQERSTSHDITRQAADVPKEAARCPQQAHSASHQLMSGHLQPGSELEHTLGSHDSSKLDDWAEDDAGAATAGDLCSDEEIDIMSIDELANSEQPAQQSNAGASHPAAAAAASQPSGRRSAAPWNAARLKPGQTEVLGGQQLWAAPPAQQPADSAPDAQPEAATAHDASQQQQPQTVVAHDAVAGPDTTADQLGAQAADSMHEVVESAQEAPDRVHSQSPGAAAAAGDDQASKADAPAPASPLASTGVSPFKSIQETAQPDATEQAEPGMAARRLDFDAAQDAGASPEQHAATPPAEHQPEDTARVQQPSPLSIHPGAADQLRSPVDKAAAKAVDKDPGEPADDTIFAPVDAEDLQISIAQAAQDAPVPDADSAWPQAMAADSYSDAVELLPNIMPGSCFHVGQLVEHRTVLPCGTLSWTAASVLGAGDPGSILISHQLVSTEQTSHASQCPALLLYNPMDKLC